MPKLANPLNDTRIKVLKPHDKRYAVADGGDPVLEVMTSGSKVWRFRYSLHGKQQPLVTIGDYPAVTPGHPESGRANTRRSLPREAPRSPMPRRIGAQRSPSTQSETLERSGLKPKSRTSLRPTAPREIGQVLCTVYASKICGAPPTSKLALHLLVITMVRKSGLIEAEWSEIDLDEGIWRIPAERMKNDREHGVQLSTPAKAMFTELRGLSYSERFIFPMARGSGDRPIAKSTLNQAVRAMNATVQNFVLHDFRRTASTHLHEMGLASDAIEKALAHKITGIKGIYNRAEYADERRKILQLWADFVEAQVDEGKKVVIGKFGRTANAN